MSVLDHLRSCAFVLVLSVLSVFLAPSWGWTGTNTLPELQQLQNDPGQWAIPAKDYASTRYSRLDQITRENVEELRLSWTFSSGELRGHEGQPLVIGNTMYLITPYPNRVFALDLSGDPYRVKWSFTPDQNSKAQGIACCDVVNRGLAYADGKIFFNSLDAHTYALDAETGSVIWKTRQAEVTGGATMTMAPLVVKDLVISGISGGELGVRGFLTANDVETGDQVWRAYSTGPDEEVLLGEDFEPYYGWMKGEDLGLKTYPGEEWKRGGGPPWGWYSYDPETDLLFYGTGNPGSWNPDIRKGDNLWSMTLFARDLDTGRAKWAYQWTPHDEWDYDGVNVNILADLKMDGEIREALIHFDRNGFAYTMDRTNGRVINAEPFVHVNWAKGIDMESGRPIRVPEKGTGEGSWTENICPSWMGGTNQEPASFSPRTGLAYVPFTNVCMDYKGTELEYIAGTPYVGAKERLYPGPGGHLGGLVAWDPVEAEPRWRIREDWIATSGTMVTAGNVVFYGTMDGWFKAADAKTGEVLWKFKTGSGIVGAPITYTGPDGKQYVAIWSGLGGHTGAIEVYGVQTDNPTGAYGMVNLFPDLLKHFNQAGMLYVFELP